MLCIALLMCVFTACGDKQIEEKQSGEKTFTLTVTDGDGNSTVTEIVTDKATVGEALIEKGIIEGEEGPYGLYIKTVNGITADYDTDGTYWAFYVDGEYALKGIDLTDITDGANYELKVEKG
jgi:hypothetical protein